MFARVRDVMTPGPIGVDYGQSIGDAARTMRDWGVGAVLVVRDGSLYGLVTDRDLVVRVLAGGRGVDEPVGSVCSADVIGVDADADISVAARLMREHAVRRLPVLQDGQVTGIVSHGDLALPDLALPDLTGTDLTLPDLTGSGGLGAVLAWAGRTFTVAAA
jgi:CBS domain-containing protein